MNKSINRYLDHAILKPEMSREEVRKAIKLGLDYKVRTVCVRPSDIEMAMEMCKGTETEVSCVLGFPHGIALSESKAEEAKLYVAKGVREIDMVINYGLIRSGEWDLVEKDVRVVTDITKPAGVVLKVIFETGTLKPDEIAKTTEICIKANADFVKTSTGFYGAGATPEAAKIMLDIAAGRIKVKAAGGIRDAKTARMYIDMGVERIGVGFGSTPALCDGDAAESDSTY